MEEESHLRLMACPIVNENGADEYCSSVAARPGGVPFAGGSDPDDATAGKPCCYRYHLSAPQLSNQWP
jgi:hypothetical protein